MSLRRLSGRRLLPGLLAVAAYVAPVALDLVATSGHGLQHLVSYAAEQRRAAVALGLEHPGADAPPPAAETRRIVHAHGGGPLHAHDAAVGVLLELAEQTDEESPVAPAPRDLPTGPVAEVPRVSWSPVSTAERFEDHAGPPLAFRLRPLLPPPRG
ncbi:MAG: hypothetical protein R3E98_10040 [Gemmatimonadota bacterium]|nr:hypothetical protein [Gemmatimonadota bacterium]